MMAKVLYFDTNIFSDLQGRRNNVTAADELAICSAVREGKISIVLSVLNFEEMLYMFNPNSPDRTLVRLQFMQNLANWDKFAKAPEQLLEDDIRSYTQNGSPNSPFMVDSQRKSQLHKLLNSGPEHIAQFLRRTNFFQEVENRKRNLQQRMVVAKYAVLDHFKKHGIIKRGIQTLSFADYWLSGFKQLEEALVIPLGILEICRSRGFEELLEMRSVRLCVGALLSLVYAHDFKGFQPDIGDAWDLRHAIAMSAADMFVTSDGKFAKLIKRVPMNSFEVLSLQDLLRQIC